MTKKTSKKSKASKTTKQASSPLFKVDGEFRSLLPPLTTMEYKALEDSIRKEGLREPLLVWKEKGILVDGHNRRDICKKHKIKLRIREMSFDSREDVKLWILDNQAGRRNMTTFQRIEATLKLKDTIAEQAKRNQQASGGAVRIKLDKPIHTYKMLGKRAGVSHGTVRKAEAILNKVAEGVVKEEDIDALRQGKMSVSRIHNRYCNPDSKTPPKAKQKSSQDIAGRINITLSTIERQFSRVADRTSLYDKIIEWANAKKVALEKHLE
jgi:hypothetical protein